MFEYFNGTLAEVCLLLISFAYIYISLFIPFFLFHILISLFIPFFLCFIRYFFLSVMFSSPHSFMFSFLHSCIFDSFNISLLNFFIHSINSSLMLSFSFFLFYLFFFSYLFFLITSQRYIVSFR